MNSLGQKIKSVVQADTSNFLHLVRLSGLDPANDFRYMDMRGFDFSNCDLSGFDFRGSLLAGADFANSRLDETILDEAQRFLVNNYVSSGKRSVEEEFLKACAVGGMDLVRSMISQGVAVNARYNDETALFTACENGRLDVATLLLDLGAEVDEESCGEAYEYGNPGLTALSIACLNGHLNVAALLIQRGSDVSKWYGDGGFTYLIAACTRGYYDIAELLLNHGASIDHCSTRGRSALYEACKEGHLEVAKLLFERGASVYPVQTFVNGLTDSSALMVACEQGHYQIVKMLISGGIDVGYQDGSGNSALKSATKAGQMEIVKLLLDNGAVPDDAH